MTTPTRRMPGTSAGGERPPRPDNPVVPDGEIDFDRAAGLDWATAEQLGTTDLVMLRRFPEVPPDRGHGGVWCWHVPTILEWYNLTDADRYAYAMPPVDLL